MWHRANVAMSLICIYLFVMFYSSRLLFDFRNRKSKDQTPTRFMSYVVVACPRSWKKRTCSLFNDDQPSSLINMLASSSFKRFFHSRKSEEVRLCWTRNHIRLPLIREKVKRGAMTENKQKDLTNSSSTLLVDELKKREKVLACYNSTKNTTVDKRSTKRAANDPASYVM